VRTFSEEAAKVAETRTRTRQKKLLTETKLIRAKEAAEAARGQERMATWWPKYCEDESEVFAGRYAREILKTRRGSNVKEEMQSKES